jgi:hypothetical protein
MPNVTLSYRLPDEQDEFDAAVHGVDWQSVLGEVDNEIRNWVKYGNVFKTVEEALDAARAEIRIRRQDRNLPAL